MHDLKSQDFRPVVCIGNLPVTQSTLFCMISSSEFSEPKSRQERQERRARLERESEIVKSQIQELKNKLPGLYKAGHNSAPSKQGNVSKKRPAPLGAETGDSKRQKLEYERARRVTSIFLQCNTIVKTLMKSVSLPAFAKVFIYSSKNRPLADRDRYSCNVSCMSYSTPILQPHPQANALTEVCEVRAAVSSSRYIKSTIRFAHLPCLKICGIYISQFCSQFSVHCAERCLPLHQASGHQVQQVP